MAAPGSPTLCRLAGEFCRIPATSVWIPAVSCRILSVSSPVSCGIAPGDILLGAKLVLVTHMSPTNPTRTLLRLMAALAVASLVAVPASAQLPALPLGGLPDLPAASPSAGVPGLDASASTGGHAVGVCAHVDQEGLTGTATGALPGPAQGALGTAQGLVPAFASAPDIPLPDCVELDADHPEQAVADAQNTAGGAASGFLDWVQGLFGGIF